MWYCDIQSNGFSRISQYHEECDIVIFNKNDSYRLSQYNMGCDIVIFNWKSESNKFIIFRCTLCLMWYLDIVICWHKKHEPISQYHTGCDIVILNQIVLVGYHNITRDVILWYSIKMVLIEYHNITGDVILWYSIEKVKSIRI